IAEGDLEEARGMARQADQGLAGLDADLREREERPWTNKGPGARRAEEHVRDGEAIARQLADEIDKALPKPNGLMSGDDAHRMSQLSQQQEATRKRAAELGRDLEHKAGPDGRPLVPDNLGEALRDAGRHMERAEGELRGGDARDAVGEESQAL